MNFTLKIPCYLLNMPQVFWFRIHLSSRRMDPCKIKILELLSLNFQFFKKFFSTLKMHCSLQRSLLLLSKLSSVWVRLRVDVTMPFTVSSAALCIVQTGLTRAGSESSVPIESHAICSSLGYGWGFYICSFSFFFYYTTAVPFIWIALCFLSIYFLWRKSVFWHNLVCGGMPCWHWTCYSIFM